MSDPGEPRRVGRADVSFVGSGRFVAPLDEEWAPAASDFPGLERAEVIAGFAIEVVDDPAAITPVRITVAIDGDPDLLVALALTGGDVVVETAHAVGPDRAELEFDIWWGRADVRVLLFSGIQDAGDFLAWVRSRLEKATMAEPPLDEAPMAESPLEDVPMAEEAPMEEAAPGGAEAPPLAQPVPAHAMAEMPGKARRGDIVDVTFTLSWLRVAPADGAVVAEEVVMLDPGRPVTISISAHGFRPARGTRRVRSVHLRPDRSKEVRRFRLEAVDVGVGEVTIVVRQGSETPLATLRLTPEIVTGSEQADLPPAETLVLAPDPRVTALPTISIDESLAAGEATLDIAVQIGGASVRGATRTLDKAAVVGDTYERIRTLSKDLVAEADAGERMQRGLRELRSIGVGLSRKLFSRDVRRFLWEHLDELDHLLIQTTGEFDIPWEIVYVSDPDDTVEGKDVILDQFLGMRGATRWVYNTAWTEHVTIGPGRAKYLCPTYRDRRLVLTFSHEEGELVKSAFHAKLVRPGDAASIAKVVREGFDLLHFGGHGVWTDAPPDQRLLLSRFRKTGDPPAGSSYTASDLRRDLPDRSMVDRSRAAPMVFLNACDVGRTDTSAPGLGGFPEAFLRGGVGVLVGCCWAVDDQVARRFVGDFYDALKTSDVAGAVSRARRSSLENSDLSGLAYVAYAHPHATITIA